MVYAAVSTLCAVATPTGAPTSSKSSRAACALSTATSGSSWAKCTSATFSSILASRRLSPMSSAFSSPSFAAVIAFSSSPLLRCAETAAGVKRTCPSLSARASRSLTTRTASCASSLATCALTIVSKARASPGRKPRSRKVDMDSLAVCRASCGFVASCASASLLSAAASPFLSICSRKMASALFRGAIASSPCRSRALDSACQALASPSRSLVFWKPLTAWWAAFSASSPSPRFVWARASASATFAADLMSPSCSATLRACLAFPNAASGLPRLRCISDRVSSAPSSLLESPDAWALLSCSPAIRCAFARSPLARVAATATWKASASPPLSPASLNAASAFSAVSKASAGADSTASFASDRSFAASLLAIAAARGGRLRERRPLPRGEVA
mmetsp:Transcript_120271/g.373850  ORF Transcript_120271/g.373850 Transcript_120271/m.373850 type:complete len:391 (-) Transcript_120271:7-1179(-)